MTVLLLALLPCIILMVAVYRQDRVEREPVRLLLWLFVLGCISTFPAVLLELAGNAILYSAGLDFYDGLYQVLLNFVVVGFVEEGLKYLALRLGSWKKPAFNYVFDGVVYAVFVSLGFAAVENVIYLYVYGVSVAPLRTVTAVPLHCITGILMGHYYGLAKYCIETGNSKAGKSDLCLSFIVPALLHGLYDYYISTSLSGGWGFLVLVIVIDIRMIRRIRRYSAADRPVRQDSGRPIKPDSGSPNRPASGRPVRTIYRSISERPIRQDSGSSIEQDAGRPVSRDTGAGSGDPRNPGSSNVIHDQPDTRTGEADNSQTYYDNTGEYLRKEVFPFVGK